MLDKKQEFLSITCRNSPYFI